MYVGTQAPFNSLRIDNGASVANAFCYIGQYPVSNNRVEVSGPGSVWTNTFDLYLGYYGIGSQLLITNGAAVFDRSVFIGQWSGANNNVAMVTGTNSLWSSLGNLNVGNTGSGNQLVVSNGAVVANSTGYLGYNSGSDNNTAVVNGAGSTWTSLRDLRVGNSGSGNRLLLQSGGSATTAGSAYIGYGGGSSNNLLRVTRSTLTVADNLDVRRGTLRLDIGSTVTTANLLATNASLDGGGFVTFHGGTLSVSNSTVDNGAALVVGNGSTLAIFTRCLATASIRSTTV